MIHYVHVDSTKRDTTLYPYGNSYTVSLATPIRNVQCIELVSAIIPNTLYTFTSGTFTYNGTSYTIPSGFYSPEQMAATLQTLTELKVVFLPQELRFVFSSHASFTLTVSGDFIQLLGNPSGTSVSSDGTPYQYDRYYIRSSTPCTLVQNEYVTLDIEEFHSQHFISTQKNAVTETEPIPNTNRYIIKNTLNKLITHPFAYIPMDVPPGHYKNFTEKRDFGVTVHTFIPRLDRLTVRWLDTDGRPIAFNGVESHAFVLRIHSISSAPVHLYLNSHQRSREQGYTRRM